jgi:hypothetical protein
MDKTKHKRRKRDDIAQVVADITGVSPRYVNMVRDGERNNELVEMIAVEYHLGKNKLIKHLEQLVPLEKSTNRYANQKN